MTGLRVRILGSSRRPVEPHQHSNALLRATNAGELDELQETGVESGHYKNDTVRGDL